jgi:hypothetical protein
MTRARPQDRLEAAAKVSLGWQKRAGAMTTLAGRTFIDLDTAVRLDLIIECSGFVER